MKTRAQGNFLEAWGGLASLELGLSIVWTESRRRGIPITDVARWMSEKPAKLAGLDHCKGAIRVGNDADLVVFDPERKRQIDPTRLQHRHAITPYAGAILEGAVEMTFVRGEKVYDQGRVPGRGERGAMLAGLIDLASGTVRRRCTGRERRVLRAQGGSAESRRSRFHSGQVYGSRQMDGRLGVNPQAHAGPRLVRYTAWDPGVIRTVDVDTSFFVGNFPSHCSLDLANVILSPREADWKPAIGKVRLEGGDHNLFDLDNNASPATHVRLNIFPDGGVARLRVYGDATPDFAELAASGEPLDVASVLSGGRALASSDEFFGPRHNLIMPGRSPNMGGGWETRRRRGPGYDWIIVKLGTRANIWRIAVETQHYKGNYPDACSIDSCDAPAALTEDLITGRIPWAEIVHATKLAPDAVRVFENELKAAGAATHVRLNIYPDGGISRLRVFGKIVE